MNIIGSPPVTSDYVDDIRTSAGNSVRGATIVNGTVILQESRIQRSRVPMTL